MSGEAYGSGDLSPHALVSESLAEASKEAVTTADGKAWRIDREVIAWIAWTLLADLLIFRTVGVAGPALFLALAVSVLWLGRQRPAKILAATFCSLFLLLISARLAWSHHGLTLMVGIVAIPALALALNGSMPWLLETIVIGLRSILDGASRIAQRRFRRFSPTSPVASSYAVTSIVLPLVACLVFGSIFVLANPDLNQWVMGKLEGLSSRMTEFLRGFSPWEIPFCIAALLIGAGLIYPANPLRQIGPVQPLVTDSLSEAKSPLYAAYRNTLSTLIVLFLAYLAFEFTTLWRRDFPPGFYYAGYAHEGAAWLTFALALATALLSLVFSGSSLRDPRLQRLKSLAWIWSTANLLLALAVYNRLFIYIGYNGMTRMRTVGLFGITLVVIGFALVLFKIRGNRSFWWLLRTQLLAMAGAIAAYSLFPVDYVAHRYNASRVLNGYLHPSVMIAVKPIDDEGVFPLLSLVDHPEPIIREGVLAKLAERQLQIERFSTERPWHWTRFQGVKLVLYQELQPHESLWRHYLTNAADREAAILAFQSYAMRWY